MRVDWFYTKFTLYINIYTDTSNSTRRIPLTLDLN